MFTVSPSVLLIAEAYVANTRFGRTIRKDLKAWEMVLAVMDERLYHKRGFQSVWFTLAQGCSAEPMSESGATWCPWPVGQEKFSSCSEGFQHALFP